MSAPVFPDLFDAVPDALVLVDGHGRVVRANSQAEQLFGYPKSGLGDVDIESLLPESARARHKEHRTRYMEKPHVRLMGASGQTLTGQRMDGTTFPVEIALSPIQDGGGSRYLASVRDISESHRARQALVRAGYDSLIAHIGQIALEAGGIDRAIDQAARLLAERLEVDGIIVVLAKTGLASLEIRAAHGDDAEELAARIDQQSLLEAISAHEPIVVDDFSARACRHAFPLRPDGYSSGVLLPLIDRSPLGGALIAISSEAHKFDHDALHLLQSAANLISAVVQRRRMEEQLAHSQRLDALGQLTGGIAHDFNNLLTVMSGSLQLLEIECANKSTSMELIASALRSVQRGAELTSKLLVFARRQRLLPQALELPMLLGDLELMLRRTLGDSIALRIDCPAELPAVLADPAQLDAALVNLALNARDAMPRGGSITIEAEERLLGGDHSLGELRPGRYLCLSVTDDGRGMNPDTLERAIEPFFTTKESGLGSGLGLSMVYGFAKQSGGHLRIESKLGTGTRVELYLPAASCAATSPRPIGALSDTGRGESILVVEDDESVRDIAVAFLRSAGYRVRSTATAEAGLEEFESGQPIDLLFSDVMLGSGMDGRALARRLLQKQPGLAVLLTSGYESNSEVSRESVDLLPKPYRREELINAVRNVLDAKIREMPEEPGATVDQ